jgi:hypothetical protein
LKRSLRVVEDEGDPPAQAPRTVAIGEHVVSVTDTGDGRSVVRFVDLLLGAGAAPVDSASDAKADIRVVIREPAKTPETRLRAEAVEEAADVVLGSARPAFARLFASACAHWVNS